MATVTTPSVSDIMRKVSAHGTSVLTPKEFAVYSGYKKSQADSQEGEYHSTVLPNGGISGGGTFGDQQAPRHTDPAGKAALLSFAAAPRGGSSNAAEHDSPNGGLQAGSANAAEHDYNLNHPTTPNSTGFAGNPGKAADDLFPAPASISAGLGGEGEGGGSLDQLGAGLLSPTTSSSSSASGGQSANLQLPGFTAPDAPNFHIARQDFSKQAADNVATAYKPRYDALDTGRANARTSYNTSDAVIKGLYDNLAKTDSASKTADAVRYDQAAATQKAAGNDLQGKVDQTYNATDASQAALWKSLGIAPGTNVASLLAGSASDRNNAKTNAAQQSDAQNASINNQKQTQLDYQTNQARANQTNGKADREGLVNQLGSVLSGYDQNQQDLAGQQANQALTQSNALSTEDLGTQQANAQGQQTAYSNALQKAQQEYAAQAANIQFQNQQNNQNQTLEQQQQQTDAANQQGQAKAAADAQQAILDQANKDRQFGLDSSNSDIQNQLNIAKYGTDLATSKAQLDERYYADQPTPTAPVGTGINDPNFANFDPATKTAIQVSAALGGDSAATAQAIQAANDVYVSGQATTKGQYINLVTQKLVQGGLQPNQALQVATSYWNNINGSSGGVPTPSGY